MNAFDQYEVWFVTGAQLLYGGDAVIAVDAHSNEMVKGLNDSGRLPVKIVYKGWAIPPSRLRRRSPAQALPRTAPPAPAYVFSPFPTGR